MALCRLKNSVTMLIIKGDYNFCYNDAKALKQFYN